MRLFVDCDDTLVVWKDAGPGPHPYGQGGSEWYFRRSLVELVDAYERLGGEVVIWTGGGVPYALTWLFRLERVLGRELDSVRAVAKDPALVRECDLQVDDQAKGMNEAGWPGTVVEPWN